ncbi:hypothetical protein [Flagellimonas allohymeniacidonis]|uniref:DoxX family protein n=1 Tax=Flagellimonas allohymeniacidonis TaxID=2517819 RepID=A0A4Q8QLM0_9FLAO|nr:hypothetical protein [Allomuricauda hymeniacidonis]TAI49166.1 hypothetical protein EW142_05045 [Allomuricauda hymeniacidonis]
MKSFIQTLVHKHPRLGVTPLRLFFMRGLYFITFIGLAFQSWEYLIFPGEPLDYITGVTFSFWATYATLMGLGIRYPLKMLPLLYLQLAYKATWAILVYFPLKSEGLLTPEASYFYSVCLTAIVLDVLIIPWSYTYKTYIQGFLNIKSQKT